MNIGTISFNINTPDFNYGAMLHSWAFQQYLLKQEFVDSAEVIDYTMPILEGRHRNMPFIDSLLHFRVRTACKQILTCRLYQERLRKFNDFVSFAHAFHTGMGTQALEKGCFRNQQVS